MKADLNPSAYDAFAPFYDAFTATSDYETFAAEVLRVATGFGMPGNRLLDLACGTGNSFEPFLRRGYRVTACDGGRGGLGAFPGEMPR
jgi:ubiquinone/menaquinone biosynthesis C-methylase UbiE